MSQQGPLDGVCASMIPEITPQREGQLAIHQLSRRVDFQFSRRPFDEAPRFFQQDRYRSSVGRVG